MVSAGMVGFVPCGLSFSRSSAHACSHSGRTGLQESEEKCQDLLSLCTELAYFFCIPLAKVSHKATPDT